MSGDFNSRKKHTQYNVSKSLLTVFRVLITARVRSTTEGYVFTGVSPVCPHCRGWEGGGLPHLHPIILLPCCMPFLGGGVGTPSPSHNTSTGPMPFLGGTPVPGRGRVPQSCSGVPTMGYPSVRSGWGTPWLGQPPLPPPGQVMQRAVRLLRFPAGRLSCSYIILHFRS